MVAPSEWFLLFDDGDVLNDNNARGPKYQKILGEYMVKHYGGKVERWIKINSEYIESFMEELFQIVARGGIAGISDYRTYFQSHMINWGKSLFSGYDLSVPSDSNLLSFYYKAIEFINPQVSSPPEGIIKVLQSLADQGYNMCTSSGETSFELQGYLSGMNADHFFTTLYGPDLLNWGKFNSSFYSKILTANRVLPPQSIVIDDNPLFLQMAKEIGIITIQSNSCKPNRVQSAYADYVYEESNELLPIISHITGFSL